MTQEMARNNGVDVESVAQLTMGWLLNTEPPRG
jgi:hypothetical protein